MNDHPGSVGDNASFVTLILAAREKSAMNATLEAIAALPYARRKALIDTLTADMKKKQAPADFIDAIAYLQNDDVAQQVRQALKG